MSNCPHCQHELSKADAQSNQCPACGRALDAPVTSDESSPSNPQQGGGRPPGKPKHEGPLPEALRGAGLPITGLSSASEPETWNVAGDAVTHQSDDMSVTDAGHSDKAPQPLELTADDIVRMSVLWGDVDDDVPSGMTIKSKESDESEDADADEKSPTLDVEELLEEEFRADDSSQTFAPEVSGADDQNVSSVEQTFVSDVFSPEDSAGPSSEKDDSADSVADTFLSDVEAGLGRQDTPDDSGGSSYDQTVVSEEFASGEIDAAGEDDAARTIPLEDEGNWVEDEDGQTFASDGPGPRSTEETPMTGERPDAGDSSDKTLVSKELSDDQFTDSGSAEDGRRTDPLASEDVSGAAVAEGSGLTIHLRSLQNKDQEESEKADYQILSLLGEGGMGKVFNARQTSIDRVVAVKMLKPKKSGRRRDQHTKFLAEAVVTGELDHPNIVPIYDVGKDDSDALFYSMKNVTGNPWLDTIHQKSAHDNLDILMSVADAVAFAHARGVVHRDLKPENVMLGEFGEVLVMDWGLAMPTDKFHKQRGVVRSTSMGGTPAYMAPEMATGPITKIGPHSDIYLLGAMLFEIVTGRPPHRGKNAMKCLMSAARNKIVSTEHTGELIDIAYKAMATDPKDRYKSVQEFQAAVRTYLAHSVSITLAALAEDDLERAQTTDNYQDYAKAQFGFEEALKLWDGNKRAKSSLGAARLAYAHCAMGKEDYDLAASLLDAEDMSHQKLKSDIVKAKGERDARQKRLEAAKRLGMALALLLFVVVSGAAVWINNERNIAEAATVAAVQAEAEERRLKEEAIDTAEQLRIANELAETRRQAAEAQQVVASLNAMMADEQKLIAEDAVIKERQAKEEEALAKEKEAKERERAEAQEKIALAQSVVAGLNAIMADEQKLIAEAAYLAEQDAKEQERQAKEKEKVQRERAEGQEKIALAQSVVAGLNAIMADEQKLIAEAAAISERNAREEERLAKEKEAQERQRAEAQEKIALAQSVVAGLNSIMADEQKLIAEAAEIAERRERRKAEEAKLAEEREAYISKVGLAAAKIEENSFDTARDLLLTTNARFRNWEWGHLMHLCEQSQKDYPEKENGKERLEAVALVGAGPEFVVAGHHGLVEIRNIDQQDEVLKTLPVSPDLTVWDVAVSPNGRLIALATDDHKDGYIKLYDRERQQFLGISLGEKDTSYQTRDDYKEKLRNRHMDAVVGVQFSQNGSKLLSASEDGTARVWDVATGRQLAALPDVDAKKPGHHGVVFDAAFCPNYQKDAQGGSKWLPETMIVTVSEDKTARVWSDPTGKWNDQNAITVRLPFTSQETPIYAVACSPDGQYIATAGFDRRVLLWRPADMPQITEEEEFKRTLAGERIPETPYRELIGHNAPVRSVAFGGSNPESRDLVLLTGSDDNTLKVWNVDRESTEPKVSAVKTFRGHGGYVRDCVFNPEGKWILSVGHDRRAKQWSIGPDAETEVHLVNGSPLDGHQDHVDAVAFSDDAKRLATASRDTTAQIYELKNNGEQANESWEPTHRIQEGHTNLIPSGVYFDGGQRLATAGFDNTARVWDMVLGTERLRLTGTGYNGVIAVSPNGRWILTGSDNLDPNNEKWKAKLWDATADEYSAKEPIPLPMFGQEVTAVAIGDDPGQDGSLLLAAGDAGGRLVLWRYTPSDGTLTQARNLTHFQDRLAHTDRIVGLRFLPNGRRLLSASWDKAVVQWDLATGRPLDPLMMSHPEEVSSMDLSADGRLLVTTCFDDTVRVWNVESGQAVRQFKAKGGVGTLITNLTKQLGLKRYSNETLENAWKLLNPDMGYQAFLDQGGWAQGVEPLLAKIPAPDPEQNQDAFNELVGRLAALFEITQDELLRAATSSAAISPDGRYVVAANRIDRLVHGWLLPADPDSNGGPKEFTIKNELDTWGTAISTSQNRTDLVVLGFGEIKHWMLTPNENNPDKPVNADSSITLDAQDAVASASFSPDGDYFVTGSLDNAARVWSVTSGRAVAKLAGVHTAPINSVVWAPKGYGNANENYLLTASDDRTAVLWRLTPMEGGRFAHEKVQTFEGHTGRVLDAAFFSDGKWVVTVSADQTIRVWDTQTAQIVAQTTEQQQEELIQGNEVTCVAVCGDGKRILTGYGNDAMIWSIKDKELKPELWLRGHSARITDVAFSPLEDINGDGMFSEGAKYDLDGDGIRDESEQFGSRAVTASADNTVIVWDTRIPKESDEMPPKAKQVLALKRHNRPVNAVRFSPDGRYILTGSEDHRAILWPTKDWLAEKRAELEKNPNPSAQTFVRKAE